MIDIVSITAVDEDNHVKEEARRYLVVQLGLAEGTQDRYGERRCA